MTDFINSIIKDIGDDYTQLASEIDNTETYVDSGSYIFNALVSGSILGGVSDNKITAIAGESSTGKTFFSLAVVQNFLDSNPDGICLYFDTESAITREMLESRGIDTSRTVVLNVVTIEEFRTKALQAIDKYLKLPEDKRQPMMFVLDSLGMLSTEKEISDALADKQVRDIEKDEVFLSDLAKKTLETENSFDAKKVEAIKQAIEDGNYPLNSRKIAESFIAMESLIGNAKRK